jgi:hypothetical protein
MNWDAIGAVGQILGAAAVFISLGYLAVQLKISNVTARHSSQNAFLADYGRMLESLYKDPELVQLLRHTLAHGFNRLKGAEQQRVHYVMVQNHMLTFNMYLQMQAGHFDRRIANPLIHYFASICKAPAVREWWEPQRGLWDRGYIAYIDSLINDPNLPSLEQVQPWWTEPAT